MHIDNKIKVTEILSKVTGRSVASINPDGDLKNEIHIDSIQLVELFAMLEKEFKVELPLEMMNAKTGSQFMKTLDEELAKVNKSAEAIT